MCSSCLDSRISVPTNLRSYPSTSSQPYNMTWGKSSVNVLKRVSSTPELCTQWTEAYAHHINVRCSEANVGAAVAQCEYVITLDRFMVYFIRKIIRDRLQGDLQLCNVLRLFVVYTASSSITHSTQNNDSMANLNRSCMATKCPTFWRFKQDILTGLAESALRHLGYINLQAVHWQINNFLANHDSLSPNLAMDNLCNIWHWSFLFLQRNAAAPFHKRRNRAGQGPLIFSGGSMAGAPLSGVLNRTF